MAALLPELPQVEQYVIELTNKVRREQNLSTLKVDAALARAARAYAQYLARSEKFSHTADGSDAGSRAEKAGYKYCSIAENLSMNQSSAGFAARDLASRMMTGWINSPGHRANILMKHATEIGVGVAKSSDKAPKFISVQLFGRPSSTSYEFQVVNVSEVAVNYTFGGETLDLPPRMSATHSACLPSELVFSKPGGLLSAAKELSRMRAEDGKLYTVKANDRGTLAVDTSARKKVQ